MKILTVANMYPSAKDPTYGTFVKNFVDRLNKLNTGGSNKVVTICGRRNGKFSKLLTYIGYYFRLTYALISGSYDLIYVHTITFPTPALRIASLFKSLPLVFNVHGDDVLPDNNFKKRLKRLSRKLLPKALMIVSPSEYFKGIILSEFSELDPQKIFISPSGGIDRKFFIDKSNHISSGSPIEIGFVSRIDEKKGWDTFLQALSELRTKAIPFHATIAGRGAQSSLMLAMIEQLHLSDCVDYIGPVAHEKLPEVYASFDLFIFPSTRPNESLGLVGLEAMAAGTPVIASNMAGPAGYVTDTQNGFLFNPGDANDLCNKIAAFIALPEARKAEMGRLAKTTAAAYESTAVANALFKKLKTLKNE